MLFSELGRYDPRSLFLASQRPALIVHGDRDTYVSYEIARETAASRANCQFHRITGSDHGFDSQEREDEAITVTVNWLNALAARRQDD